MVRPSSLLLLSLLVSTGSAAAGAPAVLPDPATVTVPDVTPSADPKVHDEGYKFYYFHNPSVSFAEAVQDFTECRAHLAIGSVQVPGFVAWDEAQRRRDYKGVPTYQPVASPYGLVGGIMADIIVPKMERGARSNKMRRCMGTRGYERYAIPEAAWNMINQGDERQIILMQAKLSTGPR